MKNQLTQFAAFSRVLLQRLVRLSLRWYWSEKEQAWNLRATRWGRSRASVTPCGLWHTWDEDGCGGENDRCRYAEHMEWENRQHAAKREAWKSCEHQGFIPSA
jgi:hypothetical protein